MIRAPSFQVESNCFIAASRAHGEDNAEAHLAAVHLFVGFRHAAERIFLDHRVHAGQRTEFQCVLRIFRCAGIPAIKLAAGFLV